uniref:Uncharacterized protein n=1 Tax=Anopheles stephensi TaxID=30069 RepID=A0A182YIN6_ANOST
MENVKRAKKSGLLRRLGKSFREECERELEAKYLQGPSTLQPNPSQVATDNDLHITDEEMHEEIYVHELDTGMAENAEYEEEWISFSDEEDEEEDDAEQLL